MQNWYRIVKYYHTLITDKEGLIIVFQTFINRYLLRCIDWAWHANKCIILGAEYTSTPNAETK